MPRNTPRTYDANHHPLTHGATWQLGRNPNARFALRSTRANKRVDMIRLVNRTKQRGDHADALVVKLHGEAPDARCLWNLTYSWWQHKRQLEQSGLLHRCHFVVDETDGGAYTVYLSVRVDTTVMSHPLGGCIISGSHDKAEDWHELGTNLLQGILDEQDAETATPEGGVEIQLGYLSRHFRQPRG
jgi:hypothetical protein